MGLKVGVAGPTNVKGDGSIEVLVRWQLLDLLLDTLIMLHLCLKF